MCVWGHIDPKPHTHDPNNLCTQKMIVGLLGKQDTTDLECYDYFDI